MIALGRFRVGPVFLVSECLCVTQLVEMGYTCHRRKHVMMRTQQVEMDAREIA
jgi:hypothetical protein